MTTNHTTQHRVRPAVSLGRMVGAVVTAVALSTLFAGTAAASDNTPGKGCNSPACAVKTPAPPKAPESPQGPDTIVPSPDKPGGCQSSTVCFP